MEATDTTLTDGFVALRCVYAASFDNLYIDGFKSYYQPVESLKKNLVQSSNSSHPKGAPPMTTWQKIQRLFQSRKFWVLIAGLVTIAGALATDQIDGWQAVQAAIAALAVYSTGIAIVDAGEAAAESPPQATRPRSKMGILPCHSHFTTEAQRHGENQENKICFLLTQAFLSVILSVSVPLW